MTGVGLLHESLIRHLASVAGLTEAWCREAMRLLAVEDVSGLVGSELNRLRQAAATRAAGRTPSEWDEGAARDALEGRAHHAYAAKVVRPLLLESVSLACWESLVGAAAIASHIRWLNDGPPEMPSSLRCLEEWCRSAEADEMAARIDAEVNAPEYVSPPVAWRDPGPDPFGMGWDWVRPDES